MSNLAFDFFGTHPPVADDGLFDFGGASDEGGVSLRFYQEEAHRAIMDGFAENSRLLLVLPTGMGKTRVFVSIIERWAREQKGRVLVLAHTTELIDQAISELRKLTSLPVGKEKAEWTESGEPVVVGSMQSVRSAKRLARFKDFSLVIIDEAHRSECSSYQKIVAGIPGCKLLGVTATPDRTDGKALGKTFDEVAYVVDILDGINWGYLARIKAISVSVNVDISTVKKTAGDFSAKELDEKMMAAVEGAVDTIVKEYPTQKAICFFPGVRTAEYAAERFNAVDPGSAAVVSGKTAVEERVGIVRAAKAGRIQRLCNCQVFTEGFDWPEASLIVLCRPTQSRALQAQMIGRGTRALPGVADVSWIPNSRDGAEARQQRIAESNKPYVTVLDFTPQAGKHDLCTPEDVLGGEYTSAEVKMAKKKARGAGEEVDVLDALNSARAELKRMAAAVVAKVTRTKTEYNPFVLMGVKRDTRADTAFGSRPPSEAMVNALLKLGIPQDEVGRLSNRNAQQLLRAGIKRIKEGKCSFKQARVLKRWGLPTDITYPNAKKVMDYLAGKGWGRTGQVDPDELRQLAQ